MTTSATQRKLGATGLTVFPIALGCMSMSGIYGPVDETESLATIHAAIDSGANLLDTGDFYGSGLNEMLIAKAIRSCRNRVLLSVKFGAMRGPDNSWLGFDARPIAMKNFLTYSLRRLGTDCIDIYRPSRLDPQVPIEDTIGAMSEMVKAGYVRHVGLSEVGAETIRRAAAVHPISDLQIEYSLVSRSPEQKIFPVLAELGIGATLYSVLGRGLLTSSKPTAKGDFRAHMPRFSGENRARNEELVSRLKAIASAKGVTQSQLAIAWVLAVQPWALPVIGARSRAQWKESLAALNVRLSPEEVAHLAAAVSPEAVAGSRYDERQMRALDSEK